MYYGPQHMRYLIASGLLCLFSATVPGQYSDGFCDNWHFYALQGSLENPPCDSLLYNEVCPALTSINLKQAETDQGLGICGHGKKEAYGGARFSCITNGLKDPNTDERLTMVPPGKSHALRVGNQEAGWQAECAEKTVVIDSNAGFLTIQYAMVMESPENHLPHQQGRFMAAVFNDQGKLIPHSRHTISGKDLKEKGFIQASASSCGNAWYHYWTSYILDLRPFSGQKIRLRFCTSDCALGSHYAYAYVHYSLGSAIPQSMPDLPLSMLFIPNAFTPDGDGQNDLFGAEGKAIREFEIYIFDRWGRLVFEAKRPDARWDGRWNASGEPAPEGAYLWMIRATGEDNKDYKLTGEVLLLREKK